MSRLRFPLDSGAVGRADDRFYQNHPDMIVDGRRLPIDPDTQPRLAEEWRRLYRDELPEDAPVHEEPEDDEDAVAECPYRPDRPDAYLHVFVLVPGTTRPVNNLFDFISDDSAANPSGRGYWADAFIAGVERLKAEADEANAGDPEYNSDQDFDFAWSGDNDHEQRVQAGRSLAERFWSRYAAWRGKLVYFHLLGHSHGGNVINDFTASIAGDDPERRFGDRWFVKSITYLSTPFFQKIEQPDGTRVYGSAVVYNLWNYYDLTQLTIADFSVMQATDSAVSRLAPRIGPIKDGIAAVNAGVPRLLAALQEVVSAWVALRTEQAKNAVPFVDNDANEAAARRRYETGQRALEREAQTLRDDIDGLAEAIDALLGDLDGLLLTARTGANRRQVDELRGVIEQARRRVATVSVRSQDLVTQAEGFAVQALLSTLLSLLLILLETVAELLDDDRWLRIIALTALHIVQFFDDTLQANGHYDGLSGRDHRAREVTSDDPFDNRGGYGRLRADLVPHESALHRRWQSAVTVPAFGRLKWNRFDANEPDLSAIVHTLIAQVGGHAIRPYRDTVDNVRIWVGRARRWNQTADRWVPGYDGAAATALMRRIETAVQTIVDTIDALLDKDYRLFSSGSPADTGNPGTLGYFAIVSHSISRQSLYDDARAGLVANVNRG